MQRRTYLKAMAAALPAAAMGAAAPPPIQLHCDLELDVKREKEMLKAIQNTADRAKREAKEAIVFIRLTVVIVVVWAGPKERDAPEEVRGDDVGERPIAASQSCEGRRFSRAAPSVPLCVIRASFTGATRGSSLTTASIGRSINASRSERSPTVKN